MKKIKQNSLHQLFLFLSFNLASKSNQFFHSSQSSLRDAIHPSIHPPKNQKILPGTLPKRTKGRLAKTKQRFRRGSNSRPFRLYFPDINVLYECKRNVMGHYTTKPLLRQNRKSNMEVRAGRLDSRPVSSRDGTVSMLLTGTYSICMRIQKGWRPFERVTYYRCLGKVDR